MEPGKPRSSKRHRPHVPLEQRKRTVQACVQCRMSKKKCRPGSRNQCASCVRSRQACLFESIPTSHHETRPQETLREETRPGSISSPIPWAVMAKDITVQFDKICPENTLEPDHFSTLFGLFREAVSARRQLDLGADASDVEPTSSRLAANAVGRQKALSRVAVG